MAIRRKLPQSGTQTRALPRGAYGLFLMLAVSP